MRLAVPSDDFTVEASTKQQLREVNRRSAGVSKSVSDLQTRGKHAYTLTFNTSPGQEFLTGKLTHTGFSEIHNDGFVDLTSPDFVLLRPGTWSILLVNYSTHISGSDSSYGTMNTAIEWNTPDPWFGMTDGLSDVRPWGGRTAFGGAEILRQIISWTGVVEAESAAVGFNVITDRYCPTGTPATYGFRLCLDFLGGV